MNDQQQSRADALTEIAQFLTDVVTAAGLLSYGHADKKLATRITDQAYELRKRMYFLTASPVEQPAAAPASANETGAEGGSERFIVIGHGESDIPEAKIVARRADVLDAVLSMIYGGPCPDDAMRAEYASMLGDWDGDHWNVTFEIGGIDVWRASLSRSPAMAAAAPADEHSTIECQAHSGPDCIECNGTGAWSGSADERAVSFEAWCDRFPEISAVERLRDAWQEARAAASPAAEAVTITDAEAEMLVGIKKFHTHDFGRGPELHADAITDAYKRGRAAAPQPAQASPAAERVTAALQALSADVHTLGDGWANDEAMIGLAKKYLRVEPKPASPELSLWRDFVLLAVTDTAPQPAQADALGEEAYVAKRMTETLATVYATIIGDDEVDTDDGLNAIERVVRAAQVLRLEVDLYRAQADAPDDTHKFKNFHRRLCERFGYVHDEIDWRRDQVSLIEWIAKKADAPAEAREPIAWMTDDDRAITAAQKQRALADGGATASSVRPYSVPCYAVSAPADAGEAVPIAIYQVGCGIQQGQVTYRDADKAEYDERQPSSRRIVYTAPPAARVASLTNSQREAIEFAAKTMEARMLNAHACVLRALLNGADKS